MATRPCVHGRDGMIAIYILAAIGALVVLSVIGLVVRALLWIDD